MAWSRSSFLLFGVVAATGCSTSSKPPSSGAKPPAVAAPTLNVTPHVVHANDALNVPTFAWLDATNVKIPAHATATDVAWSTLKSVASSFKLGPAAIANAHITNTHD